MVGGGFVNSQHAVLFVDFGDDRFAGKHRVRPRFIAFNRDSQGRRCNDRLPRNFTE